MSHEDAAAPQERQRRIREKLAQAESDLDQYTEMWRAAGFGTWLAMAAAEIVAGAKQRVDELRQSASELEGGKHG